ncbi:MAG: 16S rRNA (cytidine(1402)-2'-O)-methyltransferase [Bacteroidia bacterium]
MKLWIVPTPIGNLEDITLRAINVLKESDIILAEDTRKSGILLKHYEIQKKLVSYHQHNEHQTTLSIINKIKEGTKTALITDAGTPGISDPGFLIIRECIKNNIEIECLPGATAFVPALVVSGLPTDKFVFEGFLPVKKGRSTRLEELSLEARTMIFYESPHRLLKTLLQFSQVFGNERKASISREISKLHEETVRGSLKELHEYFSTHTLKGEFVIVVEGKKYNYVGIDLKV